MKPDFPVVSSLTRLSMPWGVSLTVTSMVSPWFISSVWEFGVKLAIVCVAGPGGPVGTPSFWMKAKLTGSVQFGLHVVKLGRHSRLSMLSAAHQCVLSQLILLLKG